MNAELILRLGRRHKPVLDSPAREGAKATEAPHTKRKRELIETLEQSRSKRLHHLESTKALVAAASEKDFHTQYALFLGTDAVEYKIRAEIQNTEALLTKHCAEYPSARVRPDEATKKQISNIFSKASQLQELAEDARELSKRHSLGSLLYAATRAPTVEEASVAITKAIVAVVLWCQVLKWDKPAGHEQVQRHHGAERWIGKLTDGYGAKDWCPVLKVYSSSGSVKAYHIFPPVLGSPMMEFLFGPSDKKDAMAQLHGPTMSITNGIFLHIGIGQLFEAFRVAIVPATADQDDGEFQMLVMDESLMSWDEGLETKLSFLHGKSLQFRGSLRPGKAYLYWHYIMALYRASEGFRDVANEEWRRIVPRTTDVGKAGKSPGRTTANRSPNKMGLAYQLNSSLFDAEVNQYWGAEGAWLRKTYLTSMSAHFGLEFADLDAEGHGLEIPGDDLGELGNCILGVDIGIDY
jgi:hypothetical protein